MCRTIDLTKLTVQGRGDKQDKLQDLHIVASQDDADCNWPLAKAILSPIDLWLANGHNIRLTDCLTIPGVGHRMRIIPHSRERSQAVEFGQVPSANRGYADSCRWRLCNQTVGKRHTLCCRACHTSFPLPKDFRFIACSMRHRHSALLCTWLSWRHCRDSVCDWVHISAAHHILLESSIGSWQLHLQQPCCVLGLTL